VNRHEYERLIQTCDEVLLHHLGQPEIIAVPMLHVMNGHPNSTAKYRFAFSDRTIVQKLGVWFYQRAHLLYKLAQSLAADKHWYCHLHQADIVFISHYVSAANGEADFYYGRLPQFLAEKGLLTCSGLVDHTPGSKKGFGTAKSALFPKTLSFADEWRILKQRLYARRTLLRSKHQAADPAARKIIGEAAIAALSPEAAAALRIGSCVQRMLQHTGARHLVLTWEGWSWERLAVSMARDKHIQSIGYQHTILFESSHSLKRSLGMQYDPDIVCTLGDITAGILRNSGGLQHTKLVTYGSHRFSGTAICPEAVSENSCLVVPEGIEPEALLLFGFAVEIAKKQPSVRFIFRSHPVLPFQALAEKYQELKVLPENCSLSTSPNINEDFKRSQFLLYRGSSVVLYAALHGLRPVYYQRPSELSIDPLFALNTDWRTVVCSEADFASIIEKSQGLNMEQKDRLARETREFCMNYVCAPKQETFYELVSSDIQ